MKNELSIAEYKELQFQVTPQMKYRNQKTIVDGITFDSKKEANRYGKLKLLKKEGSVLDFRMQVRYNIVINGMKICTYVSDFDVDWKSGKTTVEDTKGILTPEFKLKRKLMKAVLGIDIKVI